MDRVPLTITVSDLFYCRNPTCRRRHVTSTRLEPVRAAFAADITVGKVRHREKWTLPTCCGQVRDATPAKAKPPEACCREGLRYAGRVVECATG